VRLEHYRNAIENWGVDKVIASKDLPPSKFLGVWAAFPPFLDLGIPGADTACIFNPHHRIIITDVSGNVTTIEVCFECDHISILHGNERYGQTERTPLLWMWTLRRYFSQEGMPNSPGLYRRQWHDQSTNAAPATNAPPSAAR
jgi:hypothetical protein